jgi:alkylation response protein AidB-like acyl-CoA dehydrogenase
MNLDETVEEAAFRAEVRDWVGAHLAPLYHDGLTFTDRVAADQLLARDGYLGCAWPVALGGKNASPALTAILDEECSLAGFPRSLAPSRFGVDLLAPALIAHGSAEQHLEFLPRIRRAEILFCQGFSEPEAGSDLANARCALEANGNDFVVNGSKIWTTQAREADWCFALVRSNRDAPRHQNLSLVLLDMHQPGVTIRPLVQSTGEAEFNEVFFDEVRVDRAHVIGGLDNGWRVAMTMVGAERSYGQLSRFRTYMKELRAIAELVRESDELSTDAWTQEIGEIAADLAGIRDLSYKITSLAAAGEPVDSLPSVTKLWWSTSHQRLVELGYELACATGRDVDHWLTQWLKVRAESIYAGTTQIQKNIIAERMLGLPR